MPPRKRTTRINSRAKPKTPEGDQGKLLTEQERARKLDVFLQDYDTRVEAYLKVMENKKIQLIKSVTVKLKSEILQLPQEVRDMSMDDFIEAGGTVGSALEFLEQQVREENRSVVCPMSSKLVRTISQKRPNLLTETILEEQCGASPVPRQTSRRKAGNRSTMKKMYEHHESSVYRPSSTLLSSSLRTRYRTPSHRTLAEVGFETPLITPKFDPKLPYTPAGVREPKPGERLLSVTGSPVSNHADPTYLATDPRIKVRNNRLSLHINNIDNMSELDFDIPHSQLQKVLNVFTTMMKKNKQ